MDGVKSTANVNKSSGEELSNVKGLIDFTREISKAF